MRLNTKGLRPTYTYRTSGNTGGLIFLWGMLAFFLSLFIAWVTHVFWIIMTLSSDLGATAGQMVLGAIGVFMPPVGVLHGFMIWFGFGL